MDTPQPHVRFQVEKVIGVSSAGNVRSYQVQWAPAWVSGFHLVGCEHLINEFLQQQHLDKRTEVTDEVSRTGGSSQLNDASTAHSTHGGEIASQGSPAQQLNVQLLEGDENPVEDNDYQCDTDEDEFDSSEIVCSRDIDVGAANFEMRVDKSPELPPRSHVVEVKEEDGLEMYSHAHEKHNDIETGNTDVLYKHLDRVNSPESFRLNNISYLMEKSNQDGGIEDHTHSHEEVSSSSSNPFLILSNEHQYQQIHQHQTQTYPHSSSQSSSHRTSMVEFPSHRVAKPRQMMTDSKDKPKPYVCEHCDRGFSQRHHLKEHVRTHTGAKPFSCGVCSKTFSQRGTLNRHIQTHVKAAMLD